MRRNLRRIRRPGSGREASTQRFENWGLIARRLNGRSRWIVYPPKQNKSRARSVSRTIDQFFLARPRLQISVTYIRQEALRRAQPPSLVISKDLDDQARQCAAMLIDRLNKPEIQMLLAILPVASGNSQFTTLVDTLEAAVDEPDCAADADSDPTSGFAPGAYFSTEQPSGYDAHLTEQYGTIV